MIIKQQTTSNGKQTKSGLSKKDREIQANLKLKFKGK